MASLITAGAVPVAEHAYRDREEHVRNDQRQDEVPQIVIPGVPGDYVVGIGAAIKARKGFAHVLKAGRHKRIISGPPTIPILPFTHPNSFANSVQLTRGG